MALGFHQIGFLISFVIHFSWIEWYKYCVLFGLIWFYWLMYLHGSANHCENTSKTHIVEKNLGSSEFYCSLLIQITWRRRMKFFVCKSNWAVIVFVVSWIGFIGCEPDLKGI